VPFLRPSAFVKTDVPLFPVAGQRGRSIWFGCVDAPRAAGQILDGEGEIRTEASDSQFSPSGGQPLSGMGLAEHALPAELSLPNHLGGGQDIAAWARGL